VAGYAGDFTLAAPAEGHLAGTLAHVTVSAANPSRLVLDFSDHCRGQAQAAVLLCGHVGVRALLETGYIGPLVTRPRLAPTCARTPPNAD
jgi:hypothetical protein